MSSNIKFCDHNMLGTTIPYKGNIEKCILSGIKHANYSVQFMLPRDNPYRSSNVTKNDLLTSQKVLDRNPLNVFIHTSYMYNLAGLKKLNSLAWNGSQEVDNKVNLCIKALEEELAISSLLKNDYNHTGVVLHPGAWGDGKNEQEIKDGLNTIAKSINKIKFPTNSTLLLETMVGRGGVLGISYEQLKYIINNVDNDKQQYLKICLDTCHVFANGSYNPGCIKDIDRMFNEFVNIFGNIKLLGLIHLNDSETCFHSNSDRHALIGTGYIWKDNTDSLRYLLDKIQEYQIPTVLETDVTDYDVIQGILDN